jgi:hypothetical protein
MLMFEVCFVNTSVLCARKADLFFLKWQVRVYRLCILLLTCTSKTFVVQKQSKTEVPIKS